MQNLGAAVCRASGNLPEEVLHYFQRPSCNFPPCVRLWFEDVGPYLHSKPEILEALQDPSRVFNQDETAVEHGVGDQWVLSRKGEKQTYGVSSCTREHTTISFTVNAAGGVVEPRVVFSGVRDIAKNKLKLPEDGLTGK